MPNSTIFSGIKITLFGHSSVLLEADGLSIYADPYVLPKGSKPADVILYTHGHFDHAAPAPSITTGKTVSIGHGCKLPVRVIEIGATEKVGRATIEAVAAYNIGKPFHPKGAGAGYIISFPTGTVYIAGDTDFIPEMKKIKCDVAIVPIGGTYTMGETDAAEAIAAIMPKMAIPYHFGYLSDMNANTALFQKLVEDKTGGKVNVRVLAP